MTTEIMQEVLRMLDKKMITEGRNVLLFLDNAPSHPKILEEGLKKHEAGVSSQEYHIISAALWWWHNQKL